VSDAACQFLFAWTSSTPTRTVLSMVVAMCKNHPAGGTACFSKRKAKPRESICGYRAQPAARGGHVHRKIDNLQAAPNQRL